MLFGSFLLHLSLALLLHVLHVSSFDYQSEVEEHWFQARIDHFNYQPTTSSSQTFPLRYLVHKNSWNPNNENRTVLFYAGNEADIFQFVNNTGIMFEIAKELNSMVIFAEHRYYGLSKPFGEYSFEKGYNISFLTVEQAMQDFNTLNLHIRKKWNMTMAVPFIVFGGSYGGNLAMWLRLKQPNLWAGAIASSVTPLKHLLRETNGFTKIETEVYANVSEVCPDLVRKGWKELFEYSSTKTGQLHIAKELSLCKPIISSHGGDETVQILHGWISAALETMVQYGYPYPTSFYNPVPAYPFKVACENMQQSQTGLEALKAAALVYYNYTGQAGHCFDLESMIIPNAKRFLRRRNRFETLSAISKRNTRISKAINKSTKSTSRNLLSQEDDDELDDVERAWDYQTCTEVYQPMPTDGITDFEIPFQPNETEYFEYCFKKWGTIPRPNWEEM